MNGAELIAAERQRQIDVEGWTAAIRRLVMNVELLDAALCYAGSQGARLSRIR